MLGVLDEIRMRARLLRERLRQEPEDVEAAVDSLKKLERELAEALELLSGPDTK